MTKSQYTMYYHAMPFRGCFVSYLFAYADEPLSIDTRAESLIALFKTPPEQQTLPLMGPPLLREEDTGCLLSQTPAIVGYVSPRFGLSPKDPFEAAMCMKILMDCNDVLMEICRYNGSFMWEYAEWTHFRRERLPKWMRIFEQSLKQGYIGKAQMSYADIGVYALFGNMTRCLPELDADLRQHAPGIHQLCQQIGAQPSLASKVAEDENQYGNVYCGGQIEGSIRKMLVRDMINHQP